MAGQNSRNARNKRPECMETLGLAPPYTAEDVKQAYFERARRVHPDRGGSAADFQRLHEAFEQAQEFVAFRGDRRGWIAEKMSAYVAVQNAIERVEQIGAQVVTRTVDWLEKSVGDFAQLTETVETVRLEDSPRGDQLLQVLVEERPALRILTAVELPGCQVSDQSLLLLSVYQELRRLDLRRTPITSEGLRIVEEIPSLQQIDLDGVAAGWWARRRVQAKLRKRRATAGKRLSFSHGSMASHS